MSIYIHIPFCNNICSYCDFCKIIYNKKYITKYLDNLEKEIKNRYQGEIINTIFIGGGTPSSLDDKELIRLLEIIKIFNVSDILEYTIECNIDDLTPSKLEIMRKYNINRISIGIQSFDDTVIKLLGRTHTRNSAIEKIKLVKKYFTNINIDLIYAAYNDINILKSDINTFLSLEIPHVSTYSLIIEDNTKLKIDNYNTVKEEVDYAMYNYIDKTLRESGYHHYEISNYAKYGYESKHNLVYWDNDYYYGFGLGSTSYLNNNRMVNTKNLTKYLNGTYLDSEEYEEENIRIENEIMLGLRKLEGINLSKFKDKYKKDIEDIYNIKPLLDDKYLIKENNYLKINKEYMYISNEIIVRIFI